MDSNRLPTPTALRKTNTELRKALTSHHEFKVDSDDQWGDDFKPESPPPLPRFDLSESYFAPTTQWNEDRKFQDGPCNLQTTGAASTADIHRDFDMSEGDGNLEDLRNPESHSANPSTSTLFHDPQHNITILLTSPEDESPRLNFSDSSNPICRSSSVKSLPPISLHHGHPDLNTSLLMPPKDNHQREQKKAQEIEEVRKWLIKFINSKGDKFTREVRQRMMSEYRIGEFDLSPEVVAKFKEEKYDEGVSIHDNDELDQKASLQILSQAFQSQIKEVTPHRTYQTPLPMTHNGRNSRPVVPRPKSTLVTIPDDRELPPTWIDPRISTSVNSRDTVLGDPRYLRKSFSTPDLHGSPRPQLVKRISTPAPKVEPKQGLERTRGRKIGGLKGAFGSFVGSFGGGSSGVRALKKSRLGHPISTKV